MDVPTSVLIEDEIQIPLGIDSLTAFRLWAVSDAFPSPGRIDFVDGRIEVETSRADIFHHSAPKTEIGCGIANRIKATRLGHVFIDKTRVSCPEVGLSVEPDVVLVTHESIATGRVSLVPTASKRGNSFIEMEGPPDLVVEVVSRSSLSKDTDRLLEAYFAAGVREYWLVDARGKELCFQILSRGEAGVGQLTRGFAPVTADAEGWRFSAVLGAAYQLERTAGPGDFWEYELRESVPGQ
jgi:Uma2 family endonuclease